MPAKPIAKLPPRIRRIPGGCENCRNRHIRCDKTLPSCAQCSKRGFECPGYPRRQWRWQPGFAPSSPTNMSELNHHIRDLGQPLSPLKPIASDQGTHKSSDVAFIHKSTIAMPLSSFNMTLSQECREKYFLDHYFNHTANIISMMTGRTNPFGEKLKPHMSHNIALNSIVVATSALHMAQSNIDQDGMAYAWHYRAMAISKLEKDLAKQSDSLAVLTAILFMGMTECWFDPRSSGTEHLHSAKRLLLRRLDSNKKIPPFLAYCLCWLETLASFVSDNEGLVYSSPAIYEVLSASDIHTERRNMNSSSSFDPLVGSWGTLMPHVGRVGSIIRRLRKGPYTVELEDLFEGVEKDLLEWEPPQGTKIPGCSLECDSLKPVSFSPNADRCQLHGESRPAFSSTQNHYTNEFYSLAEAYRFSALLILYNYSPYLRVKRFALIPEQDSASDFLSELAYSTIALLQRIPLGSALWHACSIPLLTAGQLMTKSSDREFIRSVMRMLTQKIRLHAVDSVSKLLEEVWSQRDAGMEVWWMDVLDRTGSPLLVN
ncbi:fungal-specific transcription factor domain-containing protein [Ilyonectria sp. MPI-CAGE-AT-0026]|nr:fungal-specific transcription factor domain-containing protein [Ilyonectria sp. MPI-CAGE-AT-0026]